MTTLAPPGCDYCHFVTSKMAPRYQIKIGDSDGSTDETAEICRKEHIEKKDIIKYLFYI